MPKINMSTGSKKESKQENMNFGEALEKLKQREKVAREGWNGKGMYITLIPAGNAMYQGCLLYTSPSPRD